MNGIGVGGWRRPAEVDQVGGSGDDRDHSKVVAPLRPGPGEVVPIRERVGVGVQPVAALSLLLQQRLVATGGGIEAPAILSTGASEATGTAVLAGRVQVDRGPAQLA